MPQDKAIDTKNIKTLDFKADWKIFDTKDANGNVVIEGYANTSEKDRVGDIVLPEAFQKCLPVYLKNPILLYQHNWDCVIGKCIEVNIDEKGLKVKAVLSKAKDVEDVRTKINEGILKTLSIGYNEVNSDFDEEKQAKIVKELELLEISVVSIPANVQAEFQVSPSSQAEPSAENEGKGLSHEISYSQLVKDVKSISDSIQTIMKEFKMPENQETTPPVKAPEDVPPPAAAVVEEKPVDMEMKDCLKSMDAKLGEMVKYLKEMVDMQKAAKPEKPAEEEKPEINDEDAEKELEAILGQLEIV